MPFCNISYSQNKPSINQAVLAATVKGQAAKMSTAFISGDYKTYSSYTYPSLLKAMGGSAKMADVLTKTVNTLQTKGMRFSYISFDEPTRL
jgi:hypothetical protein